MLKPEKRLLDKVIGIRKHYMHLTPHYFKYMTEMITSDNEDNKRWAAQELTKAFVKMIPQGIEGTGEDGEITLKWKNGKDETDNN